MIGLPCLTRPAFPPRPATGVEEVLERVITDIPPPPAARTPPQGPDLRQRVRQL